MVSIHVRPLFNNLVVAETARGSLPAIHPEALPDDPPVP